MQAREAGIELRKKTLLVEYKKRGKVNTFKDRRFGEYDAVRNRAAPAAIAGAPPSPQAGLKADTAAHCTPL